MRLIASNLFVYLTEKLHRGTVEASNNVTNWYGAVLMTPLIGAHFADAYLGRCWTFVIGSAIYFMATKVNNIVGKMFLVAREGSPSTSTSLFVCLEHDDNLPDHIAIGYCGSTMQESFHGGSKGLNGEEKMDVCQAQFCLETMASGRVTMARFQSVHRDDIGSRLGTRFDR